MKPLVFFLSLFVSSVVWAQTVQENINTSYSPWSVSAFSLITSELDQANDGGMLNSYNFIGPNYRLTPTERIALKAAFNANSTGHDRFNGDCTQQQDAEIANPFLEYRNTNLGFLPGIADMFWYGRIYIPISKSSRRKQTIARYRSNLILTRWITQGLSVEFRNDISFYHQSKTTYFGTHSDECQIVDNQGPSNTRQYRLDNWFSSWYRFNQRLSLGASLIFRQDGYNQTDAFETSRQRFGRMTEVKAMFGPSLRYNYSNNLSFIFSFRDVVEYSG
ncbi:MAG: hypothetical protein AAF203_07795, partial [Pseudomonadota bacterium]